MRTSLSSAKVSPIKRFSQELATSTLRILALDLRAVFLSLKFHLDLFYYLKFYSLYVSFYKFTFSLYESHTLFSTNKGPLNVGFGVRVRPSPPYLHAISNFQPLLEGDQMTR